MIMVWGSPPRVRGKLLADPRRCLYSRITPARAGKTDNKTHELSGWEDHPRACGENTETAQATNEYPGSPPRVRGKPS